MDHWDAVLPGKVLRLQYEQLVRDPEAQIRRLLSHCGLPFETACLSFHETKRPVRTASAEQVRQPLYTSGVGYWRHFEAHLEPLTPRPGRLAGAVRRYPVEPAGPSTERSISVPIARSLTGNAFAGHDPGKAQIAVCLVQHKIRGDAMRMTKVRSVGNRTRMLPARALPSPTRLSLAIATALSGAATVHIAPALAAEASTETTASTSTLEEVIVTARKRTENLQDVPISIDVYTAKDLQNLAISQFEDYATITPSISFVSAGPGTQTFVMRGVSDGSNPNYSNTATTAFLVDDMSMNFYGTTPDLHFYDIERIEVLNGPQGTTFGASAMAGALRFITNKPDPTGFSAGADLDGGKIEGGTQERHGRGLHEHSADRRLDGAAHFPPISDYHGGYIDNINTTRNWVNGTVSNNSQWAGQNYNVEQVTGGRLALGQKIADGWKATLTAQLSEAAHARRLGREPDHRRRDGRGPGHGRDDLSRWPVSAPSARRTWLASVRNSSSTTPRRWTSISRATSESAIWCTRIPTGHRTITWVNEYSEYMQYVNTGPPNNYTAVNRQGFACQTGPGWSAIPTGYQAAPFSGCGVPTQWYNYTSKVYRWSNELRLQSKEDSGLWLHWLIGAYWERTRDDISDYYAIPALKPSGDAFQYYASYYGASPSRRDRASGTPTPSATTICR